MFFRRVEQPSDPIVSAVQTLYLDSFEPAVRKPFKAFFPDNGDVPCRLWVAEDGEGALLAFAEVIFSAKVAVIEYLVTHPRARRQGIGGEMLAFLNRTFEHQALMVEVEPLDTADNVTSLRQAFYRKHGYFDLHQPVSFFATELTLMATTPGISYQDYIQPYVEVYGPKIREKIQYLV